jgi:hypothetical protein
MAINNQGDIDDFFSRIGEDGVLGPGESAMPHRRGFYASSA